MRLNKQSDGYVNSRFIYETFESSSGFFIAATPKGKNSMNERIDCCPIINEEETFLSCKIIDAQYFFFESVNEFQNKTFCSIQQIDANFCVNVNSFRGKVTFASPGRRFLELEQAAVSANDNKCK